ncbi:hypothetical protein [Pseudonocardia sp. HH130630-07]|uniref:hypothetical protein n=1 Tax=Pseudonocardia sp. HH130630-07 TaxID=1690815 RepID=UPI000815266A|nr:hypothetical protein [Pseudonocardia sp. HH130630-07]ANY06627.1 hypothetical protein AFB00_10345 [Pseudonocardia sp. HH130630-07]
MTDLGGLTALRADIARGGEHLTRAQAALDAAGSGTLGVPDLDAACSRFLERRRDGHKRVADCAGQINRALGETQKAYAETEQAVTGSFGRPAP